MTRQIKNTRKLRKCDSSDNDKKSNLDRPSLVQIPGKQVVKDEEILVSPEAQENYAHNVNTGSQLRNSQGGKSFSSLKNETFERLNDCQNTALLKQTEPSKSGKNYGFGLDLPDSLRAAKKNTKVIIKKSSSDDMNLEEKSSTKLDSATKSQELVNKPSKITVSKYNSKIKDNSFMELESYSAFMKRVSLGMSALACLTVAMWWGQYNQVSNGEGLRVPEVAMMQSSLKVNYHLVSEKVKRIGSNTVFFVDFELSSPRLDLSKVYAELDRRILRSEANSSFRFRFFKPNDKNNPHFDLFAAVKPNKKVVERFENHEKYRGYSVLWNSKVE